MAGCGRKKMGEESGALHDGLVARLRTGKGKIGLGRLTLYAETLRQGGWLLVASVVAGVLFYFSNVFVGRMLGPADYGIFVSLNSLSLILGVVAGVVQTIVTNYVAHLWSQGAVAEIGALSIHLLKRLLPWGIGGAFSLSLASRPLAAFLQIPSLLPIIVLGLFLVPMAVLPVVYGVLQGLQRFSALGGTLISVAVFRLIAAVGLIGLGLGATGAVASLPLSSLGAFVLGMYFLGDVLRQRERRVTPEMSGLFEYSLHAALAIISFAILINSDVIMVKSRFSPTEAGGYSAISTLGKTIFWLSSAVGMLLLPKATEQYARGRSAMGMLCKSLLAVGLLCGGTTAIFLLFPTLIVGILFGKQYLMSASLLGLYGLAMTFYSLVNVWLIYCLAVKDKRYTYFLVIGAISLVVLLGTNSSDLKSVVTVLIGVGVVLCLSGWLLLFVMGGRRS
jgi:O-antigen/teichoic acid export membrane protein